MTAPLAPSSCPDENSIVEFALGSLDAAKREAIATHVDGCTSCGSLVAAAAAGLEEGDIPDVDPSAATYHRAPAPSPPKAPVTKRLPRGTNLGRYMVVAPLGSGGLGDVYVAYDPELDRKVAIKLLRPQAGPALELQARIRREAQAMAKLAHPNVVHVYDVGAYDDQVFLAMELVQGQTIRGWLKSEPRSWQQIRDVFVEAGRGLLAAHEAGLVHRDFKPQNVMVSSDGRTQVLDFGLARAVVEAAAGPPVPSPIPSVSHSGSSLADPLTESGAVVGTPAYMAPEQFSGKGVDARSDAFSFCVALYEALYGTRPFQGKSPRELIAAIKVGDIAEPGPSTTRPPVWLRKAVVRGLAAHPADRFSSMGRLLEALTVDRRTRRRQWVVVAGAGLISAIVAYGVVKTLRPPAAVAQSDAVEDLTIEARAAAAKSYYLYPPVSDPGEATAFRKVIALEGLDPPADEAGRQRGNELRQEFATTLVRLGDHFWERSGGRPFAADYYAEALAFDPDNERARGRAVLTATQLAMLLDRAASGEFTDAELMAAAPLAVLAAQDEAERQRRLANLYSGDIDVPLTASAHLETVLGADALRRAGAPTLVAARVPDAADDDGAFDTDLGDADGDGDAADTGQVEVPAAPGARRRRRRGRRKPRAETAPESLPGDPPGDAKAASKEASLGRAALRAGRYDEAERHFRRALAADPGNAAARYGLSLVYFERGFYGRARTWASKAVAAAPNNAQYRMQLGDALFRLHVYEEALRQYERAKKLGHKGAARRIMRVKQTVGQPK